MKILEEKKLIKLIRKSKNIVILGLSEKTKEWISRYKLHNSLFAMLDNDEKKQNTFFEGVKIISENELTKEHLLILPTNPYMKSFLNQIKAKGLKLFAMEYDARNYGSLFEDKFKFFIELCDYNSTLSKEHLHFHIAPKLYKHLVWYNLPIETVTTKNNEHYYFKKRKVPKNCFYFSYHSIGKKKKNLLRLKEGYFHDQVFYDKKGFSGFSSKISKEKIQNISPQKAQKDFDKIYKNYTAKNLSKYKQNECTNTNLPKDYIFYATQTTNDVVMKLSYFEPIGLLEKIAKKAIKENVNLVIKRHPRCLDEDMTKLLKNLAKYKNIYISDDSIHTLIKNSKCVLAINSGVGFEALMHLKPVVLFGKADYESCCATCKDIKTLKFDQKLLNHEKILYIKQFISYFMNKQHFNINDEKQIQKLLYKKLKKYFKHHLVKEF